MSLRTKRHLFYLIWVLVITTGPFTVLLNTATYAPIDKIIKNDVLFLVTLQRVSGLIAFVLVGSQIFFGAFMPKIVQVIGARAFRLHIVQGIASVVFILLHPILQSVIDYRVEGVIRPFLAPVVGRFGEFYYLLGRIAFVILLITIFVGYFRTKINFRRIWRNVHLFNYLAFYLIFFHSFKLGSDVNTLPFSIVFYSGFMIVNLSIIYRLYASKVISRIFSPLKSSQQNQSRFN